MTESRMFTDEQILEINDLKIALQDLKHQLIIYNNAVGVPNPDGWELATDSSGVVTWKAYEEVYFNPNLTQRWVREGAEYVNRMTKEQMEAFKKASEK